MGLFEKANRDRAKMLEERGITEDEWHREILEGDIERRRKRQVGTSEERIKKALGDRHAEAGEAIASLAATLVREYATEADKIIVMNPEVRQLADDLERVELDFARIDDVFGIITDEERDEIYKRRGEVFKRLGEMLPGLWY